MNSSAELNQALVIIDTIKGMMRLKARTKAIVLNLVTLIKAARKKKIPIIYVRHILKKTSYSKFDKSLRPVKGDLIIEKTDYSAFKGTSLTRLLKAKNVNKVIISGVYSDLCIRYTCEDASKKHFTQIIPRDCIVSFSGDDLGTINKLQSLKRLTVTDSKSLIQSDFDLTKISEGNIAPK